MHTCSFSEVRIVMKQDSTHVLGENVFNPSRSELHVAQVVTRGDVVGGAQIHILELCRYLRSRGHRFTILAGGDKDGVFGQIVRAHHLSFVTIPHLGREINPLRDMLAFRELLRVLRGLLPDVVALHTAKAGWLGRAACHVAGLPAVFTPHGWSIGSRLSPVQGRIYTVLERAMAPVTAAIINVCDFDRDLARARGIADRPYVRVIRNGISDTEVPRAVPDLQPPTIVMTARMADPKDHCALIDALSSLRHLSWGLRFIGNGPLEDSIRQRVADLALEHRVKFSGSISTTAVARHLAAAQVFALTSRFEALPISILEAMRAGLPVIATATGGVQEAVTHGRTGLLIKNGCTEELVAALRLLLTTPELRVRLGAEGRRKFEQEFTVRTMAERTAHVYMLARALRAGRRECSSAVMRGSGVLL
jgi:glycosyltransferase involved in cell wall biosynthesis